ncbi:MAG: TonB family protein [Tannerella sp.]|jgi:protein TonB|nr:TonB family protein [Tannerella sp.]
MAKDINLTSRKWLELIFEDKNQAYGAYVLRNESSDRHLQAIIVVILVGLAAVFLPNLIKSVIPHKAVDLTQTEEVTMVDIDTEVPEENQIKEIQNVPPPPALKATIAFVPPIIVEDSKADEVQVTQLELTDTKADISVATIEGVEGGTVDIADLQEAKEVVEEAPKVWDHAEVMPSFPGGDKEMMKFLYENLKYPVIATEQGIQGRVILRFVVGPDGSVGSVAVIRSLDPSCDKEAIRVVNKMPKWIPGKQNGTPVAVYFTLPVVFKLQN